MAVKRGLRGSADWKRIVLGALVAIGISLGLSALFAWLVLREVIRYEWMNYLAVLTIMLSSFVGAAAAGGSLEYGMCVPAAGVLYWLMLFGINVIWFGGEMDGAGACALAVTGGCGTALLLPGRRGGKRYGRRKYRHR